jgi:hypothetical protein
MTTRKPSWRKIILVSGLIGVVIYVFKGWEGVTDLFFGMAALLGIGAFVNTDRLDDFLENLLEKLREKKTLTESDITDLELKLKGIDLSEDD